MWPSFGGNANRESCGAPDKTAQGSRSRRLGLQDVWRRGYDREALGSHGVRDRQTPAVQVIPAVPRHDHFCIPGDTADAS